MDDHKVLRVVGMSSTSLFDKNDPLNPVNRRISIVVLNKKTEDAFLAEDLGETSDGAAAPVEGSAPAGQAATRS